MVSADEVRSTAGLGLREPEAVRGTCVVLGAGNIFSIAPLDALYVLYADNRSVALKLNPVTDRLLPVFVRHLHAAVFADAGHAWNASFRLGDVKTSLGAAVGADTFLGHGLPITFTTGVAHGFAGRGGTRAYFRAGLSF